MAKIMIKSTNIKSLDYDKKSQVLIVEFQKGGTYQYNGVSVDEYTKLLDAKSIGSYFQRVFKKQFTGHKM